MVAGFNLLVTFFPKTGEVPQAPLIQRHRKYLGGKERDQPPSSAQDFSCTCSRLAWRPISIQDLCLSKVQGSPATSSGEQSLSQRCSVVLLLLPLDNQLWGRNKQLKPWKLLLAGTVSPGVWKALVAGKVLEGNSWAWRIKPPLCSTHKGASGCPSTSRLWQLGVNDHLHLSCLSNDEVRVLSLRLAQEKLDGNITWPCRQLELPLSTTSTSLSLSLTCPQAHLQPLNALLVPGEELYLFFA